MTEGATQFNIMAWWVKDSATSALMTSLLSGLIHKIIFMYSYLNICINVLIWYSNCGSYTLILGIGITPLEPVVLFIMDIIAGADPVLCTLNCHFDGFYHISASCLIDYLKLSSADHTAADSNMW